VRLEWDEWNILWEDQHSLHDAQEKSVMKAARELQKNKGQGMIKSTEWSESVGLLMFRGKIDVPKDRDLRHQVVEQHHDTHAAGHAGCFVRGHPSISLLPLFLTMSICISHSLYTYPTTSIPLQPPRDNRHFSLISRYPMILPTSLQPRLMPHNYHYPHWSNITWP
jgi:hypothetical protein